MTILDLKTNQNFSLKCRNQQLSMAAKSTTKQKQIRIELTQPGKRKKMQGWLKGKSGWQPDQNMMQAKWNMTSHSKDAKVNTLKYKEAQQQAYHGFKVNNSTAAWLGTQHAHAGNIGIKF